jgi:hypothetical protein
MGVVRIAREAAGEPRPRLPFYGQWEADERLLETETFATLADGVRWGREHAPVVLVRPGEPGTAYYSAGEREPEFDPPLDRWSEDED